MDAYNKARLAVGFPVEYELGRSMSELMEKRGKQLLARSKSLLAQVVCLDAANTPMGYFNGLFYLGGGQDPLILTTAHVLGWGGAVKYKASFHSEDDVPTTSELELLKAGKPIPNKPATPPQAHEYSPDLAVFRCKIEASAMPPLAPPLPPTNSTTGDKMYIMGYADATGSLSITDGIVSVASWDKYYTTAHADHGYSGSPVVDMRGFLLGVVERGVGIAIKQVSFVPTIAIQVFLQTGEPQLPGLPAI